VISITVSFPERSHFGYTGMPSPFYQYVNNLVVSLPIKRNTGVFMNVPAREHRAINNSIF